MTLIRENFDRVGRFSGGLGGTEKMVSALCSQAQTTNCTSGGNALSINLFDMTYQNSQIALNHFLL
jgi:hypothetical protein